MRKTIISLAFAAVAVGGPVATIGTAEAAPAHTVVSTVGDDNPDTENDKGNDDTIGDKEDDGFDHWGLLGLLGLLGLAGLAGRNKKTETYDRTDYDRTRTTDYNRGTTTGTTGTTGSTGVDTDGDGYTDRRV